MLFAEISLYWMALFVQRVVKRGVQCHLETEQEKHAAVVGELTSTGCTPRR